ncbi:MAG: hypothetical protein FWH29_06310 [Methanobrevibacter sp.]|nr:hypothetical protein [Methanobrevibacter sp.]
MENHEDYDREKVKTFISALPDTEEELKILLNHINIFNKSKQISRLNIVGNKYVMSTLKKLELENKLNIEDMVDNKDQLTTALDTGLFTNDNVDFFINLIWTQIEDSNYPETNLKEDFDRACKLEDEDLYGCEVSFYASHRKISLFDNLDINELKKAEVLKKNMDEEYVISEYVSLDEFKSRSQEDINRFNDCEEVEDFFNNITKFLNHPKNNISYKEDTENSNSFFSLLDDKSVKFLDKLEERSQKEYSLFYDIFQYLGNTFIELDSLNVAFEEENRLMFDDFEYHFDNPDRVPKLLNSFSKIFNKFSTEYEQDRDKNREFRSKSLGVSSSFYKNNNQDFKELLNFFMESKTFFERLSGIIENYIVMYIETVNIFPVSEDDDYGKSVNIILKEYDRILDNLKFIKTEMNDLNEKFTKKLNG